MASLNKVLLAGNLTRAPELRYTPGGMAVCEFGIAINRRYSSNEQTREEVCFVDIVVWGKQAESCGRYLEKGSGTLIEGRLQLDQWEDRESGAKRSKMRVVAERVQFLNRADSRGEGDFGPAPQNNYNKGQQQSNWQGNKFSGQQARPGSGNPRPPASSNNAPADGLNNPFESNDNDVEDDIPF